MNKKAEITSSRNIIILSLSSTCDYTLQDKDFLQCYYLCYLTVNTIGAISLDRPKLYQDRISNLLL